MTPANVSLLNALILIGVGLYGFVSSDYAKTALIPVGFGVIIAALNPGLRKGNKKIAHRAAGATLLILLGLAMPLKGAIGREDGAAIARVSVMLLSTLLALAVFVKSFIDVRKAKRAAAASEEN
ncbi:MAG: hypothetical protein AAF790_00125 [Planctomycetota bacterium]